MEMSWISKLISLVQVSYYFLRYIILLQFKFTVIKFILFHVLNKPEIWLFFNSALEDTPFHGGIFRCKLVIDGDFPNKPPKGYFLTKIFHPNVAQPSGDICVNTLKRDWNPAKWSLAHIFSIIKCLLIVPFPESSLNEEAGRLFMESYDDFYNQAKLYTKIHAKPNAEQAVLM